MQRGYAVSLCDSILMSQETPSSSQGSSSQETEGEPEEGDEIRLGRLPSLSRPYQPITTAHKEVIADVEERIEDFISGDYERGEEGEDAGPAPIAITGAYGSGKTQLEYHIFRRAWEEGVPAVYIGAPSEMLSEFEDVDVTSLIKWLYGDEEEGTTGKIVEEIMAMVNREYDSVFWFPDIREESKRSWIKENVPEDLTPEEVNERYVLIIDELEQSYQKFATAIDVEDQNPLRGLNDVKPEALNVWSFGLLSAYEFIGDADIRRTAQITIPPVDVGAVDQLLRQETENPAELSNFIWWTSRGRGGWAYKIVDEVGGSPNSLIDWMESLSELQFSEVDLVRPIWSQAPADQYENAARALSFSEEGYRNWLIEGEPSLSPSDAVDYIDGLLRDVERLRSDSEENHSESEGRAITMLRRNLDRTLDGLTPHSSDLLPQRLLQDEAEAKAFLNLVQNFLLSFEPRGEPRTIAYETLEEAKEGFNDDYISGLFNHDSSVEKHSWTVRPSKISNAFPPVTMNPRRLTDQRTEDLREEMGHGLWVEVEVEPDVYYCPTQNAAQSQVDEIARDPDISKPSIAFVPDDTEVSLSETGKILQDNDILEIREQSATKLWDFVVELYGYLDESEFEDPYRATVEKIESVAANAENREKRDTIETLYEQLTERVGQAAAEELMRRYSERFSIEDSIIWEHDTIAGLPDWGSTNLSDGVTSLWHILALGAELSWDQPQGNLRNAMEEGFEAELVSSNRDDAMKRLVLTDLFTQSGYSSHTNNLRDLYRTAAGTQLKDAMTNTQTLLSSLAREVDTDRVIEAVQDIEKNSWDGNFPILSNINVPDQYSLSFLRSVLAMALFREDENVEERLREVSEDIGDLRETIKGYVEDAEDADEKLSPPDIVDDAEDVDLKPAPLEKYDDNLEKVKKAVDDIASRCEQNPDFRVTAFALYYLVDPYEKLMREKIDELSVDMSDVENINEVIGLIDVFKELHRSAQDFDAADEYFDSADQLVADIERYGDDALDIQSMAGPGNIVIPDETDQIGTLNEEAEEKRGEVQDINKKLNNLIEKHEELENKQDVVSGDIDLFLEDASGWEGDNE